MSERSKFSVRRLLLAATILVVLLTAIGTIYWKFARHVELTIERWKHLQMIALAIQVYEANHGRLPPSYIADANGKPIESWREYNYVFKIEDAR